MPRRTIASTSVASGQLAFTLIGTYTDELMVEPLPGVPKFDCAGLYGTVCGTPIPEWRHKLRANWQTPWGMDLSLTWRHIDKVLVDGTNPDTGAPTVVLATDRKLGARNYLDVSASYSFTEVGVFSGLTGRLGINNLADKDPPLYRGQPTASPCIATATRSRRCTTRWAATSSSASPPTSDTGL